VNIAELLKIAYSKEFQDGVSAFILLLMDVEMADEQKIEKVIDFADGVFETLDAPAVRLIPGAGPLLAILIDLPAVNTLTREQLVRPIVETLYRGVKPKKAEDLEAAALALP
jgi:hypothetical protein